MNTRTVRVGDVLTLVRRPVRIDPAAKYREIGIRAFGKGIFHKETVPGASLRSKRVFEIHPGDLVLSNVFAWEGAIAVAGKAEDGRIGSHRFLTYRAAHDEADAGYLRYLFLSDKGLPLIQQASPGAAGRNRTLGIQAFENLKIPLPCIGEQRRIATWLDQLYERRRKASDASKRAGILVKALHDALCCVDGPPTRIGDTLRLVREPVRIDGTRKYRQIGIYSFGKGMIHREPAPGSQLSKLRYFSVPVGALVLSNIQAWEGALAISTGAEESFIASNRFLSYVPLSPDVDVRYLLYFFLSEAGHPLVRKASPGTTMRNRTLRIQAFENLKIPLPDIDEQRRIASLLDQAYSVLRRIEEREKLFDALLASALNEAFSGTG